MKSKKKITESKQNNYFFIYTYCIEIFKQIKLFNYIDAKKKHTHACSFFSLDF